MATDPRALRDPVLYNAALNDACAAMQAWLESQRAVMRLRPLTQAEVVQALTARVQNLRQPLK
jgi:hypothetical protein